MRIIISPAKKMKSDSDLLEYIDLPVYLKDTERIMKWMQQLSFEERKKLWECNDKIAELNDHRLHHMDLYKNLTPAILSYEGIQYQYMAPAVFEDGMLAYVQEHLRILSGFYGVLKPMDGVTPYRLEMQAKAEIEGYPNLYEFWGKRLYEQVVDREHIIINLASKEYSKNIEKYLTPQDCCITCIFGEIDKNKVVQKGTYAKMARGEMVRFMAENKVSKPEELKRFQRLGYTFCGEFSSDTEYVYIKQEKPCP